MPPHWRSRFLQNRYRLWELDELVRRYPSRWKSPSHAIDLEERLVEAGYPNNLARLVCLDFDLSCASFGRWVSRRQSETIERDVPKNKKPKMQVPKYRTLAQVLGMNDPDAPGADQIRSSEREELDELTEDLRRDPAALAEFLELSQ